jgi:hypothetical protein
MSYPARAAIQDKLDATAAIMNDLPEIIRRLAARATLERETTAYFKA